MPFARPRLASSLVLALVVSLVPVPACDSSDAGGGASTADGGASTADGGGAGEGGGPAGDSGAAACVPSATVHDVLSQVDGPVGRVAFDDASVYVPGKFTEGHGVERFARGAPSAGVPLAATALDYAVPDLGLLIGADVYFVGASTGELYKVSASGGAAVYTTLATGYTLLAQRRLVADADALYLLAYKGPDMVLDRIPLAGGAAQTLATLPSGPRNLALYGSDVFIAGGGIGATAIQRVAKAGGAPETLRTGWQCLQGMAVTADAVLCADTQSLVRIPRAGGLSTTLYNTPNGIDRVQDVAFSADATVAYVSDAMGKGNGRESRILRVDTASGALTTLACGLAPPHRLVVGARDLAWTSNLVNVLGKFDVQMLGL
jgi:hypothetical protein